MHVWLVLKWKLTHGVGNGIEGVSPEVHSSETDGDFSDTLNTEQAVLYHSFIIVSAFLLFSKGTEKEWKEEERWKFEQ